MNAQGSQRENNLIEKFVVPFMLSFGLLEFVIWNLSFGIWDLEFGISYFPLRFLLQRMKFTHFTFYHRVSPQDDSP